MLLDLPPQHRIPLAWLLEHGNESIRARTLLDLAPEGYASPEAIEAAREAVVTSKAAEAVTRKQKDTGIWGGNLLGVTPNARAGIKEIGTIAQYRRLVQLGYPHNTRPFKLADRVLFRLLSRDEDPWLLFEHEKWAVKDSPEAVEWVREHEREAAAAALAEAGFAEDPRLRGAAHKVATAVSNYLRSPLAENPFIRSGKTTVLSPEAHPPTWYTVAMIAAMPNLRRERAGFTERLAQYLAGTATKRAFTVKVGKKSLKPDFLLLGNPIEADAKGHPKDLTFAVYFLEQLARIGALTMSPVGMRVAARLFSECDEFGVWRPKKVPTIKKTFHPMAYHHQHREEDAKTGESRFVDVTFRLAMVAKHAGLELDYA